MIRALVLAAALMFFSPAMASADLTFYIFDTAGQDVTTRYGVGDIVEVFESSGTVTVPNTSPFRIIKVFTTKTVEDMRAYMDPKTGANARRRAYYLDTAKMSAADLAAWNRDRYIEVAEATAVSWISRK